MDRLLRLPGIASTWIQGGRDLWVYLPPSYSESADRAYPVIYAQDGQNLFSALRSDSWRAEDAMDALAYAGREFILVGIPHAGDRRIAEYSCVPDPRLGGGEGDCYLRFLTESVKPHVDAALRTQSGPESTCILGSSMGGLISLYALFRYPQVFGSAVVMSPSLWFADRAAFSLLEEAVVFPGKLYLDVGTAEGQATLENVVSFRDRSMQIPGVSDVLLQCVIADGAGHHESAWADRLWNAISFISQ